MENVVLAVSLKKIYPGLRRQPVVALGGLNLSIKGGEVFGLLGPNGSGKTTFLKLILGLAFPTSGKVIVLGNSPELLKVRRKIGYLPETPLFYDFLTPQQLLTFYASLSQVDMAGLSRRIDESLDIVGLTDVRKRRIYGFSKGMLQRLGLAVALLNDPQLLLLDEPVLGLDPIGIRDVKELIKRLRDRGKSIILCSHILKEAEDVCDRVGILYYGELIALGTVGGLKRRLGPKASLTDVYIDAIDSQRKGRDAQ